MTSDPDEPDGTAASSDVLGTPAMELLTVLLDFADAISAGVAVAAFWYAWVAPLNRGALPPPKRVSKPDELERFVRAAALIRPSSRRLT